MLNINRRLIRLLDQLVTAIKKDKSESSRNKNFSRIIRDELVFFPITVILIFTKYRRCSHSSIAPNI